MEEEIARLRDLDLQGLKIRWQNAFGRAAPAHLTRYLLFKIIAYKIQADRLGDLDTGTLNVSGGSTDRPNLQRLLDDVRARKIDVIVVYKVDRLTRSLADFAKLVELFDGHDVSFVSVTQQFNTTTSMGRLPSRPREFHPEPLTDPDLNLSIHPARAID
jgi:Resolvase, N terminal domain/Protein of unknown function (DUF2924)